MSFVELGLAQSADLRFSSVARVPHNRIQPGGTLVLQARVVNRGDAPGTGVVVATLDGVPDQQSARSIYVPPNADKQFDIYVRLPQSIATKEKIHIEFAVEVLDGSRRVMLDRDGAPATYSMVFSVDPVRSVTGLAIDQELPRVPYWRWPGDEPYASYELAVAARIASGNTRQTANFDWRPLPLSQVDLAEIDVLVISEERAVQDAASVVALQRFIVGGGRVWFMLDRIDPARIRGIFGNGQSCESIDEVEINDFTVDVASRVSPLSVADRTLSLEKPVAMRRVIQTGGEVSHSVGGWPMAIWMQIGYGEVLLTTLDSRAWIEERSAQPTTDMLYQSAYAVRPWGSRLAIRVNNQHGFRQLPGEVEYPLQYIGNPVVPKAWVAVALAGFCALLLAVGCWRFLIGDLSLLGVLAPLLAIVASCGLLIASGWVRRDIPESLSKLQLVEFGDDGRFGLVREQAAVYLDSTKALELHAALDGQATASDTVSTGIRRFIVDDFESWRLVNEDWPPGPWRYASEFVLPTREAMIVRAQLTARGVELQLPEQLPFKLEDPLMGYVPGDASLCQTVSGGLLADGSRPTDGKRWIDGTLISDEQQRRMEIYDAYFRPQESAVPLAKRLYGWTELWPEAPRWNPELPTQGAALVALPIKLQRPDVGTPVLVPHEMIRLHRDRNDPYPTFSFDDSTGLWARELTMSVAARLYFQLPEELAPFEASEIQLELDIRAPNRTVRVMVRTPEEPLEIVTLESPSIPWKSKVTDPKILDLARNGVLEVTLEVSERTDIKVGAVTTNIVAWQVEHFRASVRGQTLATSNIE